MRLKKMVEILYRISPLSLAEEWDKVGLHVGDGAWPVRRGLLCIDLTPAVLAEAVRARVDLIVAYHPPIFTPLAALTSADWKQRMMLEAARRRIAVFSPHTALDAAEGGVNDWLARGLGKGEVRFIGAKPHAAEVRYKIVTFAPAEHFVRIRGAMAKAGAGIIGDYVECAFSISGEGSFRGLEGTNPFIGRKGKLETVRELRLEMVCDALHLEDAIRALRSAHPYEEPAFDIYRLEPEPMMAGVGQGRRITLRQPITLRQLAQRVRRMLKVKRLKIAASRRTKPIRSIAVCAGAGASVLRQDMEADAWLTGEMRHHDVLDAVQRGKAVILAGHTQTERPYLPVYRRRILDAGGTIDWRVSKADQFAEFGPGY